MKIDLQEILRQEIAALEREIAAGIDGERRGATEFLARLRVIQREQWTRADA